MYRATPEVFLQKRCNICISQKNSNLTKFREWSTQSLIPMSLHTAPPANEASPGTHISQHMPEYIRTALQPFVFFSRKTWKGIQNKIPLNIFIRPRSSLIIQPFEPLVLGWFRKPKASATGMSESATPSSPSWINATLVVFSKISHSVQPVGRPAAATWQAFAQQYFFKQHTL